ncbi:hypothetical protein ZWY2020_039750 [Hordeum vulgare]|nr:hypothetical protein ZWY2020_039750 [Hordeum vulgare]
MAPADTAEPQRIPSNLSPHLPRPQEPISHQSTITLLPSPSSSMPLPLPTPYSLSALPTPPPFPLMLLRLPPCLHSSSSCSAPRLLVAIPHDPSPRS